MLFGIQDELRVPQIWPPNSKKLYRDHPQITAVNRALAVSSRSLIGPMTETEYAYSLIV